jgi:hypothetical protein
MLTDLLKSKGPKLRLFIGTYIVAIKYWEIRSRSATGASLPSEQRVPTGIESIDRLLGSTTQSFVQVPGDDRSSPPLAPPSPPPALVP